MKVFAVIPAFNEARCIGEVVAQCKHFVNEIIVVDDGSEDLTAEIARIHGAGVARHFINRGYGAALKTGMAAALKRGADIVVTLDADGQHIAEDVQRVIAPLRTGDADIVVGDRFSAASKREGMSFLRRGLIVAGNILTWLLYGVWFRDTQSGFRAYTRDALTRLHTGAEGMEFSSEVIGEAARSGLRIQLIPITVRYTEYSLAKGQHFLLGIKTALQLMLRRFLR